MKESAVLMYKSETHFILKLTSNFHGVQEIAIMNFAVLTSVFIVLYSQQISAKLVVQTQPVLPVTPIQFGSAAGSAAASAASSQSGIDLQKPSTVLVQQPLCGLNKPNKCDKDRPSTADFVSTLSPFSSTLYSSLSATPVFSKVFNESFNRMDVAANSYGSALYFANLMGLPNSEALDSSISLAVGTMADDVSPVQRFSVLSNSVEKYLNNFGLMTPANRRQLIQSYSNYLQQASDTFKASDPTDAQRVMALGTANFVKSLKPSVNPEEIRFIMSTFADEANKY